MHNVRLRPLRSNNFDATEDRTHSCRTGPYSGASLDSNPSALDAAIAATRGECPRRRRNEARRRCATSVGSPANRCARFAASSSARVASGPAVANASSALARSTPLAMSLEMTALRPERRFAVSCSTTALANRSSSISPAASSPSTASAISSFSNPTCRRRRSSSLRLRSRTARRRRARSRAIPPGRGWPSPSPGRARNPGRDPDPRAPRDPVKPLPRSDCRDPRVGSRSLRARTRSGRGLLEGRHVDDLVLVAERGEPNGFADPPLDVLSHVGVLRQELPGVLSALAELLALVREPRSRFLDDLRVHADVEEASLLRDALAVEDVELALPERRRHLVLHHLDPRARAHDLRPVLEVVDLADVEAHRRVKLQGPAPRSRFRVAEHNSDLLAELVDEDRGGVEPRQRAGE